MNESDQIPPFSTGADRNVRILRTIEEIETVRSIWEKWQIHPASTIDAYLGSLNTYPNQSPCVILLFAGGVPSTLALGRIIETYLEFKIGYLPVYRTTRRVLSIIEKGILGKDGEGDARNLIKSILSLLEHGEADMAHLASLSVESSTYDLARKLPSPWCRSYFITPEKRWLLQLPGSYQEFLNALSPKRRHNELR